MSKTPDRFPGSREETELILEDDGSGDPITSGGIKFDANKFRMKDNSAVFGPDDVRVSTNDTTPSKLSTKLVAGTGVALQVLDSGNDETLEISATGGGSSRVGLLIFKVDGGLVYDTNGHPQLKASE